MSDSPAPAETAAPSLASRITRDEAPAAAPTETTTAPTTDDSKSAVAEAQNDGAPKELNGSGLEEPEYDVEVKLIDIQGDPNSPLYSIKSFEELNLYVSTCFQNILM